MRQTGARFIARTHGTLENQYADDIRTDGKQSVLIRISKTVVKRQNTGFKKDSSSVYNQTQNY